jgi:hypothetical protein
MSGKISDKGIRVRVLRQLIMLHNALYERYEVHDWSGSIYPDFKNYLWSQVRVEDVMDILGKRLHLIIWRCGRSLLGDLKIHRFWGIEKGGRKIKLYYDINISAGVPFTAIAASQKVSEGTLRRSKEEEIKSIAWGYFHYCYFPERIRNTIILIF